MSEYKTRRRSEARMTFNQAVIFLKIEEFADAIYNSQSSGELFFISDYIALAMSYEKLGADAKERLVNMFREYFIITKNNAHSTWERPESVYQHIPGEFISYFTKKLYEARQG